MFTGAGATTNGALKKRLCLCVKQKILCVYRYENEFK